ncbi:hypothetical protein A3K55_02000 [Candidatus Shapirobacteria bacterium RBG_13_44_7]|uniref:Uncharacterized protein n=1 Tax=Candidatus Shapirobacteria bacterium RBG_13_44_7 TaxID=1802149 RepID=A0A1F7SJ49_9BACT|nr:MAG: hypothetical protein A3K55_02000 [Candidatus Shapirobacteria bacterium RBG_13_44_7]
MARITASEIIRVIEGFPPQYNPEAARRGIEAHKRIIGGMKSGQIPEILQRAGVRGPVRGEVREEVKLFDDLTLGARIDAEDERTNIELKPGDLRGRHLLQTAAGCRARGNGLGVVYFYDHERVAVLEDGGGEVWEDIGVMAAEARRILDIQAEFDNGKRSMNPQRRRELGQEAIDIRRGSFDPRVERVLGTLTRRVVGRGGR